MEVDLAADLEEVGHSYAQNFQISINKPFFLIFQVLGAAAAAAVDLAAGSAAALAVAPPFKNTSTYTSPHQNPKNSGHKDPSQ